MMPLNRTVLSLDTSTVQIALNFHLPPASMVLAVSSCPMLALLASRTSKVIVAIAVIALSEVFETVPTTVETPESDSTFQPSSSLSTLDLSRSLAA